MTQKNSWQVGLIDQMKHMLHEAKRSDGKTDFTKWATTIEGSAKVYQMRIDSYASQAKKLADRGGEPMAEDEESDEENQQPKEGEQPKDGEHDGEKPVAKKTRKKAPEAGRHIETNVAKLNLDKMEIAVVEDPLFKRTAVMVGRQPL